MCNAIAPRRAVTMPSVAVIIDERLQGRRWEKRDNIPNNRGRRRSMLKKQTLLAVAAGLALAVGSQGVEAAGKIKIGFLPGVVDPFYQVMQIGVEQAAKDLGIEVVTQ